jgi:hypothetical protein
MFYLFFTMYFKPVTINPIYLQVNNSESAPGGDGDGEVISVAINSKHSEQLALPKQLDKKKITTPVVKKQQKSIAPKQTVTPPPITSINPSTPITTTSHFGSFEHFRLNNISNENEPNNKFIIHLLNSSSVCKCLESSSSFSSNTSQIADENLVYYNNQCINSNVAFNENAVKSFARQNNHSKVATNDAASSSSSTSNHRIINEEIKKLNVSLIRTRKRIAKSYFNYMWQWEKKKKQMQEDLLKLNATLVYNKPSTAVAASVPIRKKTLKANNSTTAQQPRQMPLLELSLMERSRLELGNARSMFISNIVHDFKAVTK